MKEHKHHPILPGVLRFLGLWAGISGGYLTMGSTCPCCGRPACPVGFGIAALFGALGSFLITNGKNLLARLHGKN
jgi:hypothetical protein